MSDDTAISSHAGTPTSLPPVAMYEWERPTGSYYYPYYTSGYPTAAGYYSYPYGSYGTNPAQATARPGTGAASLGHSPDPDQMTSRAASYFFGFLITFIVVLLIFVACGIGRRRRIAARRRRREMEDGPHMVRFGGLLASGHHGRGTTRPTNEEILKKKPTYHEVWLDLHNEKHPNPPFDSEGGLDEEECKNAAQTAIRQKNGWGVIEPLAASLTRTPKDLQPYQHFHEAVTTAGSTHLRNGSQDEMPPPYDNGEGNGAWYHRLPPAWTPFGIGGRNLRRWRTPSTISPTSSGQHQRVASHDIEMNVVNEKTGPQDVETRKDGNIQVAVVVIMPNQRNSTNRPLGEDLEVGGASFGSTGMQNTLPEYQIGVTHARIGADNGRHPDDA